MSSNCIRYVKIHKQLEDIQTTGYSASVSLIQECPRKQANLSYCDICKILSPLCKKANFQQCRCSICLPYLDHVDTLLVETQTHRINRPTMSTCLKWRTAARMFVSTLSDLDRLSKHLPCYGCKLQREF